ncbi:MAG: nucleotidyltransferase domain-containing protein [Candidatus Caldarchaeales archaeon]
MKRVDIIKNWREYILKIYSATKSILLDAHIYVFGSILKGEATSESGIDILIVSKMFQKVVWKE